MKYLKIDREMGGLEGREKDMRFAIDIGGERFYPHIGHLRVLRAVCLLSSGPITIRLDNVESISRRVMVARARILLRLLRHLGVSFTFGVCRDKLSPEEAERVTSLLNLEREGGAMVACLPEYVQVCYRNGYKQKVWTNHKRVVVLKSNGQATYLLSSWVWDWKNDQGVIARSSDHVFTNAIHQHMFDLVKRRVEFYLVGLVRMKKGKISKSKGRVDLSGWSRCWLAWWELFRQVYRSSKNRTDYTVSPHTFAWLRDICLRRPDIVQTSLKRYNKYLSGYWICAYMSGGKDFQDVCKLACLVQNHLGLMFKASLDCLSICPQRRHSNYLKMLSRKLWLD